MDAQQSRRTPEPGPSGAAGAAGPQPGAAAVIVPARDDAARIALTVLAARSIPRVDLVVVVDDASTDSTARVAEESGAAVVRHRGRRGRAAALESGAAAVAACDDMENGALATGARPVARPLLLIAADLGPSAVRAESLLTPVLRAEADMAVGLPAGAAARERRAPGLRDSTERCLTRDAFEAALPLGPGGRPEPRLTAALLQGGFRVLGVPLVVVHHRPAQRRGLRLRRTDW
jgi:glycosyltransferase involved in cell wall biosynthesis